MCGGSLKDSLHLDLCNNCYEEDNFCLLCGRKIKSGEIFCMRCKAKNEKRRVVKRRVNLKKLNKNKVRVLKLGLGL